MPKYVLYRVRNCSQDIVAENCNLWLFKSNIQDLQLVYTYIYICTRANEDLLWVETPKPPW